MNRTCVFLWTLCGTLTAPAAAEVIWRAEPPVVPATVPVVRVYPSPLSRDLALRRFRSFGGPAEASFIPSPRGVVIRAGDHLYTRDATGTEFFGNVARLMAESPGEAPPISDASATAIALEHFRRHNPSLAEEAVVDRVRHLMNQESDIAADRDSPATQDESILFLNRRIGSVDVIGPLGDGASVHVDNFGNVVGMKRTWRRAVATADTHTILPWEDVRAAFLRKMEGEMGAESVAFVESVRFGYYSRPEGQPQGYMVPAYLFDVALQDTESQEMSANRLVALPAVQDPPEPLEPPGRPPEAGSRTQVIFDAARPVLPAIAPLSRLQPNVVNTDALQMKARALGISIDQTVQHPLGLTGSDTTLNAVLTFDENGAETFAHLDRFMAETPGELPPLSEGEAVEAAERHIRTLDDINPDERGPATVRHLMQQTGDSVGGEPLASTRDESIVEYTRQIPRTGYPPNPCVGPGAFYQVHVDNAGVVTGHNRVWRQLGEALGDVTLWDYATVEDHFLRQLTSELGRSIARVRSIEFGLYFRPRGFRQEYAQPAVVYTVDLVNPETGQVTARRVIPVRVTDSEPEPLDDPEASVLTPAENAFREENTIPAILGDFDGDGSVTPSDCADVLRVAAGLKGAPLETGAVQATDVAPAAPGFGDGILGLDDALRILRSIYGLDDLTAEE